MLIREERTYFHFCSKYGGSSYWCDVKESRISRSSCIQQKMHRRARRFFRHCDALPDRSKVELRQIYLSHLGPQPDQEQPYDRYGSGSILKELLQNAMTPAPRQSVSMHY